MTDLLTRLSREGLSLPNQIIKRNGSYVALDLSRVERAVTRCYESLDEYPQIPIEDIVTAVANTVASRFSNNAPPTVEAVQDIVEVALLSAGEFAAARHYIVYREDHAKQRVVVPVQVKEAFERDKEFFPTPLQRFMFYDKYSRYNWELGRRETWTETVDRVVNFLIDLSDNKLDSKVYARIHEGILTMKVMPSMRLLAMAGPAAKRNSASIYNCLAGTEEYLTRDGIKTLGDTVDTTQTVLNGAGEWVKAEVKEFGVQPLVEVTFRPGGSSRTKLRRRVQATPNHRWITSNRGEVTDLRVGDLVSFVGAPIPNSGYLEAWIAGFGFGDGTITSQGDAQVRLCGKKAAFLSHFMDYGNCGVYYPPSNKGDPTVLFHRGHFSNWKKLPTNTDAEWLSVWLAGYLAADGCYQNGRMTLSSQDGEAITFVQRIAPLTGTMVTGHSAMTNMETNYGPRKALLQTLVFRSSGEFVVISIEDLGIEEPVFCAVVEDGHDFVLAHGIHTGNCSHLPVKDIDAFAEAMLISMAGCVSGETFVQTVDGPCRIDSLVGVPFYAMVDGQEYLVDKGSFVSGTKQLYDVSLSSGHEVRATDEHPFLTRDGWKRLGQIVLGTEVRLSVQGPQDWKGEGTREDGYLLGAFIGDGEFQRDKGLVLGVSERDEGYEGIVAEAERCMVRVRAEHLRVGKAGRGTSGVFGSLSTRGFRYLRIGTWASSWGFTNNQCKSGSISGKAIPVWVEGASSDFQRAFVRGMFDTDGTVQPDPRGGRRVSLKQGYRPNLVVVQRMLSRQGVQSRIVLAARGGLEVIQGRTVQASDRWELIVSQSSLLGFEERFGFSHVRKKLLLREMLAKSIRQLQRSSEWTRVKSVNNSSIENVYDMSVEGIHAFDANGVYLHNCGVGYSVERENVEQFPRIVRQTGERQEMFVIEDSTEGWAESVRVGMRAWWSGRDVEFDYSFLRPAGVPLKVKGGRACLTADTVIYRDKRKWGVEKNCQTVGDLYSTWSRGIGRSREVTIRSLCESTGEFYRNRVMNIVSNGIADVYQITLENDYTIKATSNHRFMRLNGRYGEVVDLAVGDVLACNGTEVKTGRCLDCGAAISRRAERCKVCYDIAQLRDDASDTTARARKSCLAYRADVCEMCAVDREDSRVMEVHHIDRDPRNNDPSNLFNLCDVCHKSIHTKEDNAGIPHRQRYVTYSKIVDIAYVGREEVFDLQMQAPDHNFVANGFVSHNSGPEPLKVVLDFCRTKLLSRQGTFLRTLDAHDMMCVVGGAAVSGGVRRTAMISIFDYDDQEMRTCKDGAKLDANPWRWNANNSGVWPEQIEQIELVDQMTEMYRNRRGEPGIYSRANANASKPDRRKEAMYGPNPCLTGEMLVAVADGRGEVTIKELAEQGGDVPVYTLDDRGLVAVRMMRSPRVTGESVPVFKVTLDDGSVVRATANHKFRTKDGSYVEVADLTSGTRLKIMTKFLASFPEVLGDKSTSKRSQDYWWVNNGRTSSRLEHRYVAEFSYGVAGQCGETVHHIDCDLLGAADDLTRTLGRRASLGEWSEYAAIYGLPQSFSGWRKTHLGGMRGFLKAAALRQGFDHVDADPRVARLLQEMLDQGYDAEVVDGNLLWNKVCEACNGGFLTDRKEVAVCGRSCAMKKRWNSDPDVMKRSLLDTHELRRSQIQELQAQAYNETACALGRVPEKQEWKRACRQSGISSEMNRPSSPFQSWADLKEYASNANHIVVSVEADGFDTVYNGTVDEFHNFFVGGFESLTRAKKRKVQFVNNRQCGEIDLRPYEFCNLSIAVARPEDHYVTLRDKVWLATIIGTIQSLATTFPGLRPEWKQNCDEERLLGVDISGQQDCLAVQSVWVLQSLRDDAVATNKEYAKKLGINPSAAVTCNKPNGNSSQLLDCSSGIHARWSPYYVRNVRVSPHTPLYRVLKNAGVPMDPENGQTPQNATSWVVHFPVKAPEGAKFRRGYGAVEQCEYWLLNKLNWAEHNPSVTITYQPDELIEVVSWVWKHRDLIGGMAFLPVDDAQYKQMPYEEISEEEYYKLFEEFPEIDFSLLFGYEQTDMTEAAQTVACLSGSCEV